MAWKVKFFQTTRGNYPVLQFIEKQDTQTSSKIALSVEMLSNNGPFLKPPFAVSEPNNFFSFILRIY